MSDTSTRNGKVVVNRCMSLDGFIAAPFPEEGGKVAFKVKSAGISMPITETVLEYHPGRLQLLQMDGMLSGRARWELTPEGDGTRLTTTFDYALPGGVFGKIADALMSTSAGRHPRRLFIRNRQTVVTRGQLRR